MIPPSSTRSAGVMTQAEPSGVSTPPRGLFDALNGKVDVPPGVTCDLEHHVLGVYGRPMMFRHSWAEGRFLTEELESPLPDSSIAVETPLKDLILWVRGERSSLELLSSGRPLRINLGWSGLLEVHGAIQLTGRRRAELSWAMSDQLLDWALQVESVDRAIPIEEARARWPCPVAYPHS